MTEREEILKEEMGYVPNWGELNNLALVALEKEMERVRKTMNLYWWSVTLTLIAATILVGVVLWIV